MAGRGEIAGTRWRESNSELRLVVDLTVTDKTQMVTFARDVTRMLERITGISVHDVTWTKPENVAIKRAVPPLPSPPLGDVSGA